MSEPFFQELEKYKDKIEKVKSLSPRSLAAAKAKPAEQLDIESDLDSDIDNEIEDISGSEKTY